MIQMNIRDTNLRAHEAKGSNYKANNRIDRIIGEIELAQMDAPWIPKIDIEAKLEEIGEPWSPVDLARVNDQVIRMALFHGEYHWHRHEEEDELFYVYRGEVRIEVKGHRDVELRSGEMAVIPRNVEHRPVSACPSYVLMFEPLRLKSKGD